MNAAASQLMNVPQMRSRTVVNESAAFASPAGRRLPAVASVASGDRDGNANRGLRRERLAGNLTVDDDIAAIDRDCLAGESGDAFDVRLGRLIGIAKHDDLIPTRQPGIESVFMNQ